MLAGMHRHERRAFTINTPLNTVQSNLKVIFAKMAITEEEFDGSQVGEAHRDQRLLGLMQDLSSR
eukprot:896671-Amphidinium_carterae.1